jgi:hypothetical protein
LEFKVKLVTAKKNPKARVAILGAALLMISVFLSLADGYEKYAEFAFAAALIALIGGAIYAKGDLADIEVSSSELLMSHLEIRIDNSIYPINQVQEMHFDVDGYDGMVAPGSIKTAGNTNGMDNYLDFSYLGEKIKCRFYLSGPQDVQQLGLLFRELYGNHVAFRESSRGWDTFMLEPVTKAQLEDMKAQYGYL